MIVSVGGPSKSGGPSRPSDRPSPRRPRPRRSTPRQPLRAANTASGADGVSGADRANEADGASGAGGERGGRMSDVLDRASWASLTGPHAHLAQGTGHARRYPADVSPIMAVPPVQMIGFGMISKTRRAGRRRSPLLRHRAAAGRVDHRASRRGCAARGHRAAACRARRRGGDAGRGRRSGDAQPAGPRGRARDSRAQENSFPARRGRQCEHFCRPRRGQGQPDLPRAGRALPRPVGGKRCAGGERRRRGAAHGSRHRPAGAAEEGSGPGRRCCSPSRRPARSTRRPPPRCSRCSSG